MPDIIHLLPDSIANQIAAGEVIQRPASVVKELIENSLDAGATHIILSVKDAGRTFIQVIDNGKGMSATDLRMAFERHATSKIRSADDLFSLTTMGFRGEALPSIAAISHIEVKSRREEDELGSLLVISGSKVEKQEMVAAATGTSITVKNIFFNVPARRKFLKSNETERRNIFTEFERIVLVNPDVEFTLIENGVETLHLPKTGLRQRIVQIEGKNTNQQLIEINEETTLGKIYGYIARPEFARKGKVNQFFFVNNRYIRHPYFHRAVTTAFEPLIAANEKPGYYIYFQVDPDTIDVNIHPTKTEVKFENEQALWQILMVTVKESLGKFNAIPTIDFDRDDAPEIPVYDPSRTSSMPKVNLDPGYNPFHSHRTETPQPKVPAFGWEQLYKGFEKEKELVDEIESRIPATLFKPAGSDRNLPETELSPEHYQYKQKYILTSVKSGLMIIDQHKAHVRILFDKYLEQIRNKRGISQRVLFPEVLELSASEAAALPSIMEDLEALGFELSDLGNHSFAIQAVPSEIENAAPAALIRSMIGKSMETGSDVKSEIQESIALSLANLTAIPYGNTLTTEEMLLIVSQLFASPSPTYTPDGQTIISVISDAEIEKKMQ
ncbi:DNA mismatch repair protein MutL [Porphyromonadaceae bacterium NLAE-zl-C104]|uniref:DNA mismatch repair endonuclease MutL n=1 Tax=Proteiniphilum sp. TaxID=1926877 RepID=UPI000898AA4D|nr:DNA mismatch repair endonuclease MutL [Proteiniphilum sp.]MDY9919928.1 DNA mismatch repair endonuclease MutL [Proteiniphilum sp.]SEA37284.1 DNA mismatch repair protein MutL [Porphyromonadaceae bacterium KH3R12]SFS99873.1 DNA mismatch repair protein MutL [Porphyromonadaceae bacterium NLAE-zl-C104]